MGSPSLPMSSRSSFPPWYRVISHHGQLACSQGLRRQTGNRGGGRDTSAPAALFARLQSIEQAFAKLKALLRKAAARTVDDLWDAIAEIIELFTPTECANFFANSGYEPE